MSSSSIPAAPNEIRAVHVLSCPRSKRARLPSAFHVRPVGGSTYLPCVKHSSHSKVIINSPALVGHNQLSWATPRLLIGRQHATSARRGAPRRVPLFKPTPRLETPEKKSRTRLLHSNREVRALVFPLLPNYLRCVLRNMDVRSVEAWSKDARRVAALESQQQSPGEEQQLEDSHYLPELTLVDSGSDPRAWLALAQPPGTCAAHATSSEYLQHSPCPSTGSYHGKQFCSFKQNLNATLGARVWFNDTRL